MTNPLDRLTAALADRYAIQRELGRGGMATVYLATDIRHDRPVALKVLRPELAAALGPDRFLHEIKTTAQLTHPHILPLHDSGNADGFLYYVMPFVEGESLRDRLTREKQLPLDDALQISREVADALSYAHSHGVIHRDVKPENILLESGHAVVADFGIARAVDQAGGEKLTGTGIALGTPAYMSPEQAAGSKDLDGRSDLYALGCVLYEMLAGQPPFTGPTAENVIKQHLTVEAQSIANLRPAVPAEIAGVLARALAKTPADRFSPVAQFADALRASAPTRATAAALAPPRRWSRIGAVAVALALAGGAVGILLMDRGPAVITLGRMNQLTNAPGLELDPAISPDGRLVAYAAGQPGTIRLFVRPIGGGNAVAISEGPAGNHRYPQWSPDGSQVLFTASGGIWTVPPLGGSPRVVVRDTDSAGPGFGAWSPTGEAIVYVEDRPGTESRLVVQPLDGSTRRELAVGSQFHSPSWSPDGRFIAYVVGNAGYWYGRSIGNLGPSEVYLVPADGSAPGAAVTGGGHLHGSPSWMPDSRTLLLVSTRSGGLDVHRVTIDNRGTVADSLERLTTGIRANSVAASADGSQLVYSVITNISNVWAIDITARLPVSVRDATPVTSGTEHVEGLGVSPDGQWVVFDSDRGGNVDIWKVPAAGGDPVQLTTDPAPDFIPAFSWDGNSVVFHSWRTGNRDVFVMASDGSREERVTDHPAMDMYATWAPDGQRIAFQSDRTGRSELYITERTGEGWGEPLQLTTTGGTHSQMSPDGSTIVYVDGPRIASVDVETGRVRVLLEPFEQNGVRYSLAYPRWTLDAERIIVKATDEAGFSSFWDMSPDGGTPRLLVTFDDPTRPSGRPEFATDGRRIYFTIDNRQSDIWVMDVEW